MSAIISPETLAAIEAAEFTPSQKNSLRRLLELVRSHNDYQPMTIMAEFRQCDYFVAATIKGRRTDCEEFSPRMLHTEVHMHVFIGKRGARQLAGYAEGLSSYTKDGERRLQTIANIYHCSSIA